MFWSCGAFRLYLGASFCIYIFGSGCIFIFDWVVHVKGRYYDVFIYVSCFTLCYIDYCFIFTKLFMIYVV